MKLKSWSLHPLALPYLRKIKWARSEETASPLLLVRLVAEDGNVGAAEVAVKPLWFGTIFRSIVAALEDIFLPIAQQTDVLDERAFHVAAAGIPENTAAKALVDTALWDLRSAIERKPLWRRWGGENQAPLNCLLTRQAPELMAAEAGEQIGRYGFREIKLKGGQGVETDARAVREVRAATGVDVRIFVDTNSHYSADQTPAYLRAMADAGVLGVEDPYAMRPDARFERIQRESPIPIILDQAAWSARDTELFCERGAQALAIKPLRSGLSEGWAQARVAGRYGCKVHCGFGGESALGTLSSLQFAGSLPGREHWLGAELNYFAMLSEQVIRTPLEIVDGTLKLPDACSGAELIDWEKVERLSQAA